MSWPANPLGQKMAGLLPAGWRWEGLGLSGPEDGFLVCPHGEEIALDGRCAQGCVSPLVEQGLV